MSTAEVEAYLHQHIPLSAAMGVQVLACDAGGATLSAPFAPNINHRATVFGGSASAVAILSAWTWLHFALVGDGRPARLVIRRNTVDYLAPITGEFVAHCDGVPPASFEKFVRTLARHGKARVEVAAQLTCAGATVATFAGDYVALRVD